MKSGWDKKSGERLSAFRDVMREKGRIWRGGDRGGGKNGGGVVRRDNGWEGRKRARDGDGGDDEEKSKKKRKGKKERLRAKEQLTGEQMQEQEV